MIQPDGAAARGPLQLLDSMDGRQASKPGVVALPPGFIECLAAQQDTDTLALILQKPGELLGGG